MPATPLELLVRPPLGWCLAIVWGMLWGSFWNVAVYRIGRVAGAEDDELEAADKAAEAAPPSSPGASWWDGERAHLRWIARALASLVRPSRSACPRCNALIAARDNIPLFSWFLLGGRCRTCGARISPRYLVIEALGVALAAASYLAFVVTAPAAPVVQAARFFVYFFFAGTLLVLAAIDLERHLLPDAITWPAIPAFFLAGRCLPDVTLAEAAIGLSAGYLGVRLLDGLWILLFRRDALGGGDAKLLALVGGLLGWRALPYALFGGAILGSLVALPIVIAQRSANRRTSPAPDEEPRLGRVAIPFGPFLAAAALGYLFLGRFVYRVVAAWLLPD